VTARKRPRSATRRPTWTCPRCGHRFISRNLWHSCGNYRLADHFRRSDPVVRRVFEELKAVLRRCGPVTVYAQKTRIVFQGDVRFAGCVARRGALDVGLVLVRPARHPLLRRLEIIPPRYHVHHFRLTDPRQFDGALRALLREAYAIGRRVHVPIDGEAVSAIG
jgi:hypothetical protein